MFVDLKFSGWRLFWLRAIICYVRVKSRERDEINRWIDRETRRGRRREKLGQGEVRPSCPFGTERTLNRITIRHGDVIHLHYYFSRERPWVPCPLHQWRATLSSLRPHFHPYSSLLAQNDLSQANFVIKRKFRHLNLWVLTTILEDFVLLNLNFRVIIYFYFSKVKFENVQITGETDQYLSFSFKNTKKCNISSMLEFEQILMNDWRLCATALYSAPSLFCCCSILEYLRSNLTYCDEDKFAAWKRTPRFFLDIHCSVHDITREFLAVDFKAKRKSRDR